jgi:hypothetical protein
MVRPSLRCFDYGENRQLERPVQPGPRFDHPSQQEAVKGRDIGRDMGRDMGGSENLA